MTLDPNSSSDLEILEDDSQVTEDEDDLSILDDGDESTEESSEETEESTEEVSDEPEEKEEEPKKEAKPEVKEELSDEDLAGPPTFNRPTIGEIKKYDPNFFKKFPSMAEAILRERHYTETFPTVKMAKDAAIKAEQLDNIAAKLNEGDAEVLFDALGDNSAKLTENFLPTLYQKNPQKFREITAPIFQTALKAAANATKEDGTAWEDMRHAADYIAHFMFGKTVKNLPEKQVDPEVEKIRKEREDEIRTNSQRQLTSTIQTVASTVENVIESLNNKALEIAKLPEPRLKKINNEVIDKVQELVSSDVAHSKYMRQLWEGAKRENYSNVSVGKIKNAMLSRVKQLLPKARAEVLKDYGIVLKAGQKATPVTRPTIAGNRPASKTSGPNLTKETIRGKSDRELLDLD